MTSSAVIVIQNRSGDPCYLHNLPKKQKKRKKGKAWVNVLIIISVFLISVILSRLDFFLNLESKLYDFNFQIRGPKSVEDAGIVIVAIDQESADSLAYPFDRRHYAELIQTLNRLGAKQIIFDIEFSSRSPYPESDSLFKRAIQQAGNVILAGKIEITHHYGLKEPLMEFKPPSTTVAPAGVPTGLINDLVDPDGVTRQYPLFLAARGIRLLSLDLQAISSLEGITDTISILSTGEMKLGNYRIPTRRRTSSTLLNYYGPAGTFPIYSFISVIRGEYDFAETFAAYTEEEKAALIAAGMADLFSDIAGFTSVSEKLSPEDLISLLNEYLTAMTRVILENDGIVDKYEGDLVMSEFGAPVWYEDHAERCCRAALQMQAKLAELRIKWKAEGRDELYCRVGVNTGEMILGNMGSEEVFDYTVMGDAVNLSSRLEGANKNYETAIMIGHETYKDIKDRFITRRLDLLQVKGKKEPVDVYELLAESEDEIPARKRKALEKFAEGFQYYRTRQFSRANEKFTQALSLSPDDGPSREYFKRSSHFAIDPPPENWDFVHVLTEK